MQYHNVGNVYFAQGQLQEAKAQYQKAVNIARELNDTVRLREVGSMLAQLESHLAPKAEAQAAGLAGLSSMWIESAIASMQTKGQFQAAAFGRGYAGNA